MPRWTGTWLEGPGVTLSELRGPNSWLGSRLGLPREGSGSVAPFGVRAMAFFIDVVMTAILGSILVSASIAHPSGLERQLFGLGVLLVEQVVLIGLIGQSAGMRFLDIKVLRIKRAEKPPGFAVAVLRTFPLLLSFGLFGFFTRDGRGIHDLIAGSVVVRN